MIEFVSGSGIVRTVETSETSKKPSSMDNVLPELRTAIAGQ